MANDRPDDPQTFYSISNLLYFAASAVDSAPHDFGLGHVRPKWLRETLDASSWAPWDSGMGDLEVICPTHADPTQLLAAARTLALDAWDASGNADFKTLAAWIEALEDALVFPGLLC